MYKFLEICFSYSRFFDQDKQGLQFFTAKLLKLRNHYYFEQLRPSFIPNFFRVLPSIFSKYQFHFDQIWANISSILTNFDQRLNYWGGGGGGGVLHLPPYNDVPEHIPKFKLDITELNAFCLSVRALLIFKLY